MGALALLALVTATPAFGAAGQVEVISVNVSPTFIYNGDPVNEWIVPTPNALLSQGSVVEGSGGSSQVWFIAPTGISSGAQLDWSGSMLDQELSSGGQLEGAFLAGGSITITGEVWNLNTFTMLHSGVLLEATVSAFHVLEENDTDTITFEPGATLTPTGGYLVTNTDGLKMVGDYYFSGTVSAARENGDGVSDLSHSIVTNAGFQWTLVQVPEPAAAILLGLGLALSARPRRRSV